MKKMTFFVPLKILLLYLLLLLFPSKIIRSYEYQSTGEEQIPFIMDICKLYGPKSVIILYAESIKGKDISLFLLIISMIYIFFFLRNGNAIDDVQMETCTFPWRYNEYKLAFFTIASIIVLHKTNCTAVFYSADLWL